MWLDRQSQEPQLLANCYRNSLRLALDNQLKSIAFPCISTGIYGYPAKLAAPLAIDCVRDFGAENPGLESVTFVVFSEVDERIYRSLLKS